MENYLIAYSQNSSHTHCQAPQANAKTKACQRVCLSNRTDGKINNEGTTHGIVHAGFRGMRAFVARKKSRCKLIGNRFVIPHDTIPSNVNTNFLKTRIKNKPSSVVSGFAQKKWHTIILRVQLSKCIQF